ncbi:MAG: translation elongation factor Ts [Clostridia bacterium]|nr:translation elongation factor Ts [Clostridia bacterium]
MANFTSQDVMKLREATGVGMMDCKKALVATEGKFDEAIKYLREKGIATAAKKQDRVAAEGIIDSYIHMNGKIGVLLEVNCETDFVARSDRFKALVHDISLQIAAAKPEVVSKEDCDQSKVDIERDILTHQALNEGKPQAVVDKMVEGRIQKYYKEVCLLEQPFVKDDSKTIQQLIHEAISELGEKISIRRFTRYVVGEGIEKKKDTFIEEIQSAVDAVQK